MAGAVVFPGFADSAAYRTYTLAISVVEDYVPEQFCRRELPCILAILKTIEEVIDIMIVDGYVNLIINIHFFISKAHVDREHLPIILVEVWKLAVLLSKNNSLRFIQYAFNLLSVSYYQYLFT